MSATALTENGLGAVSHEGAGDSRVVLSYALVRGLETCSPMIDRVLEDARAFGGLEWLVDLLVMTMQTRDCREGKGERALAWQMLMRLSTVLPKSTAALVRLLPKTFGSWKDVRTLYALASTKDKNTDKPRDVAVAQLCVSMFKEQLAKDVDTLANGDKKDVSLCAKWAPREGSANSAMAKVLSKAIFVQEKDARKQYRQLVAKLNKSLETVEVKMCSKRFREISPAAVPAAALKRYRDAFIDVKKHANDEDRLTCARNFKMHAMDPTGKMHGGTLFPHELVVECEKNRSDEISLEIIQKQWEDLVRQVQTPMDTGAEDEIVMVVDEVGEVVEGEPKEKQEMVSPLGGKYVPLVDVSGSMTGTPLNVAVSMGILMSEIAHPAFKDRFISFNSTPNWIQLPADGKLHEKVTIAKSSSSFGSTNFLAAIELILDAAKKGEVAKEDMPQALFVFSDMQFDQAREDSAMARALRREGAKTGEVVISLMWNNDDDLDLHVHTPDGEQIYYGDKKSKCGGELDVDMNAGGPQSEKEPVENTFWAKAPLGEYKVSVNQYCNRTKDKEVPYVVQINVRGKVTTYNKVWKQGTAAMQKLTTFTVDAPASVVHLTEQEQVLALDWDTGYEKLEKQFKEAGYGHAPMVVFWNLKAESDNLPVRADQKGVVTCSGYSPALLKYFMEKDLVKDMQEREVALQLAEEATAAMERAAHEVAKLKQQAAEVVKDQELGEEEEEGWSDVVDVEQVQLQQDMDGKLMEAERMLEEAKEKQSVAVMDAEATGMTPTAMMRSMLDHERYTCVRELPDADQEIGMELESFLSSTMEIA